MPGIFFRHSFSLKYMAQVAFAVGANDFHPFHPERDVGMTGDRTRYLIIERGPAAAAVKLVGGVVERCIAAAANEVPLCFEVVVFSCKSPFCAFLGDHMFFFGGKGVPVLSVFFHVFFLKMCTSEQGNQQKDAALFTQKRKGVTKVKIGDLL